MPIVSTSPTHMPCVHQSEHKSLQQTVDYHICLNTYVDEEKVNLFPH